MFTRLISNLLKHRQRDMRERYSELFYVILGMVSNPVEGPSFIRVQVNVYIFQ